MVCCFQINVIHYSLENLYDYYLDWQICELTNQSLGIQAC
jgi:hypothetical protein